MREIPLDELPVVGALDRDRTPNGVVFRRVPAWTRPQLVDAPLQMVVTMPAGVRLEFTTDATELEIEAMLTVVKFGANAVPPQNFDLVGAGPDVVSAEATDYTAVLVDPKTLVAEAVAGQPAKIRFDSLPGDPSIPLQIWFPQAAVFELRAVRISAGASLHPAPRRGRRWVHYGSSISHCYEADRPTDTWPALAALLAGVDLLNLALGGQCMLDQFIARTIRDVEADLISVKAAINVVNGDQMRERTYVAALHGFIDTVRDGHPTTPLLLVTPIICPAAEEHPGPTPLGDDGRIVTIPRPAELSAGALSVRRMRALMVALVEARRDAGDQNLHLLDGRQLLGPDDVDHLPDGLHPDAEGYRRIGRRFHELAFERGVFAPVQGRSEAPSLTPPA